uniref:acyl-CoA-binding protein-like n=1 Tax=Semicossyphus pulcher TaxID=241346 RepID=UPI0037E81752
MTDSFERAAEEVMVLKNRPDYGDIAEIYGLYKQATIGEVNIERPGLFDFKGRKKWDAWNDKKGMSKDVAMAQYVDYVEKMKVKYGI